MNKTIKNIKLNLETLYQDYINYSNINDPQSPNYNHKYFNELINNINLYQEDTRIGVIKLVSFYKGKILKQQQLQNKFKNMLYIEEIAYSKGFSMVAGLDEVGRGPFAGPLISASVILPKDFYILGIDDSKKLSEEQRYYFFDYIIKHCTEYTINCVEPNIIDKINILQATKLSMLENINAFKNKPEYLIVDAVELNTNLPNYTTPKADELSISVACASIIAKVTRDKIMLDYDSQYPEYGFAKNKGYGTEEHQKALRKHGPCPIHRKTFIKNTLN
ncbi:MAG: ribonuclease HII [bacterium]